MEDYIEKNQKIVLNAQEGRNWYGALPWLFLCIALPITYFVWQSERAVEYQDKANVFQARLVETANELDRRTIPYKQALYGMRTVFNASEQVTSQQFQIVVDQMLRTKPYAALHQVGFIHLVDPMRAETYHGLRPELQKQMTPSDASKLYAPVTHLMTLQGSYDLAFGVDAFKDDDLRKDMTLSALHNKIFVSAPVGGKQTNNLMSISIPVYLYAVNRKVQDKALKETVGWLFFNVDLHALYSAVFLPNKAPDIRFSLHQYDGSQDAQHQHESTDALTLLFSNTEKSEQPSTFSGQVPVEMFGQDWDLHADSLAPFEAQLDYSDANTIGWLGLLITATITGILFLLVGRLRTFDRLKEVNRRLQLSDERWHFALEGSGDGVWDWDVVRDHIDYSKRWKQIFGFDGVELTGTFSEWESLLHPDDHQLSVDTMQAYLNGESESYSLEYRLKCKDGTWKWVLSRGMVVAKDAEGKPTRMVGTHTDISQIKESEEQIWQHANFDYLTGLPNRRMLYTRLEKEITNSKWAGTKLALLFFDIDGFKEINDTLGHDQGDVLLQQAASRLESSTFRQDVVARLGGDEFVVLIAGVALDKLLNVEVVAQKVLNTLAQPFSLKNEQAFVTASMGIAIYPDDASTIDELIKNVDQAMYVSKSRGGNCFTYFTPLMQERALNRLQLSNDLRVALEKQHLFIEYQPIVDLHTGEIYKAEALLRWQHPERGLVSPGEFIPIAEDTRLINDIGYWVFMESIKQCEAWRQTLDTRFQVAVNKSPVQFMSTDAKHDGWMDALPNTASGEQNAIVVEITESLLLEASSQVSEKLQAYRTKGVQIALDDFGTGYSSLSYLRKFEMDYLKIDRSFVANLEESAEDRVLCNAIIVMAHSLGIKVVAEGIETKEQQDILFEAGCDYGQGFYFAKSLLPVDFEAYVADKSTVDHLRP